MTMSAEEIVRDYYQAANKQKQIKILADLNCCTQGEIRKVLFEHEVPGIEAPKRIRHRTANAPPVDEQPETPPGMSVYDQIEAILANLPEDMTEAARMSAGNFLKQLFTDYLHKRLKLKGDQS